MVRKITTEHAGVERTAGSLAAALAKITKAQRFFGQVAVESLHELMRANESRSLVKISEIMVRAAAYRTESRLAPYHNRIDFPTQNDREWFGQVTVRREGKAATVGFFPNNYDAYKKKEVTA